MQHDAHSVHLAAIHDDPWGERWDPTTQQHLGECEPCRRTLEALRATLDRLKRRRQTTAPASLVAGLRRDIATLTAHHAPSPSVRPRVALAAALAAGLVLGLGLGRYLAPAPTIEAPGAGVEVARTVHDFLDDVTHDRYLLERTGHPLELVTDETDRARLWLTESLGFDVALGRVPEGWALEGTRVWHTVSRLSALASYTSPVGTITVFAVPGHGLAFEDASALEDGYWYAEGWGYRGVAWHDGELAWAAVGNTDLDGLLAWVKAYRNR